MDQTLPNKTEIIKTLKNYPQCAIFVQGATGVKFKDFSILGRRFILSNQHFYQLALQNFLMYKSI